MDAALGWIGTIFETMLRFLPHLEIIRSTHMGVKFRHGKKEIVLGPGLHWYWPLVTEIEIEAVKYRTTDLQAQYLETKDGKKVGVGGIVTYGIEDIRAALCECWDYEDVIKDKGLAAIKHVVTTNDYTYFSGSDADGKLTTRLRRELKDFGIDVSRVQLSDFAEARMIALWGLTGYSTGD